MIDHLDPPVNVSPDATSDEHENHENHHGEDDPDEARRLRRVKSNRESARRSRARKQQRLVELERSTRVLDDDVRRTRQNVALMSSVMYHVVEENRQLESECAAIGRQILAMNEQAVAKARADAIAQGAMARRGGGTTTTGTGASGGAGGGDDREGRLAEIAASHPTRAFADRGARGRGRVRVPRRRDDLRGVTPTRERTNCVLL